MTLVPSFTDLLQALSPVMTAPSFNSFLTILAGWVFTRRHTVTGMIQAANAVGSKHHSSFHRLFAQAAWSLDELGLAVFALLVWLLGEMIILTVDDTLARKRGLKVFGVGMHHDPLLSTRKTAITNWGHSWVVLGVVLKFPFRDNFHFCLPILFRLYISKQTAGRKKLLYRTRPELAVEMLQLLCPRHDNRHFNTVADSAYGGQNVLRNLPANCDLTSRLTLDARLYDAPAPPRNSRKGGRPRKRGTRLPTPQQMLKGKLRTIKLNIYGRRDTSRVADRVAHVHAVPDRPLRVVAVKPLTGGRTDQVFFSTAHTASAKQVLIWYAMRWSIETMFHDSKGSLGFEEPQGWTRQAVQRTAPTAMLLYSLIVLWFAREGHRYYQPPQRPWYIGKVHASFADMLATLRGQSVESRVSSMGLSGQGSRNVVHMLINAVRLAA
jgi:SRSO17 transposase